MVPTISPGTIAQVGTVENQFREALGVAITFIPRLIGALLILLIGWIIGRILGRVVTRLVDRVELDRMVLDTPLGNILGGTERAVSQAFGTITRWFVYALAILAAADVLAIAVLSQWINTAVSYLPAVLAGPGNRTGRSNCVGRGCTTTDGRGQPWGTRRNSLGF